MPGLTQIAHAITFLKARSIIGFEQVVYKITTTIIIFFFGYIPLLARMAGFKLVDSNGHGN